MITFLAYGKKVLAQREEDGIRGFDRELSRWNCHIATAFALLGAA